MQIYGNQGWKVFLSDNVALNRTALRIHPDTNGEGTAGCVGVREDSQTLIQLGNYLQNYFRTHETFTLTVDVTDNPNYNNAGNSSTGQ